MLVVLSLRNRLHIEGLWLHNSFCHFSSMGFIFLSYLFSTLYKEHLSQIETMTKTTTDNVDKM